MKRLILVFISFFVMIGCSTETTTNINKITGTIGYYEKMALPPEAEITITLEDITLVDTYAKKISEVVMYSDGRQAPFAYVLPYSSEMIQEHHRYMVRAKIRLGDKLIFITETANLVITDPKATTTLDLILTRVK